MSVHLHTIMSLISDNQQMRGQYGAGGCGKGGGGEVDALKWFLATRDEIPSRVE